MVEMKTGEVGRLEGEKNGWTGEQKMLKRRVMRGEATDCSLLHRPKVLEGCLLAAEEEGRGCCSRTSLYPSETSRLQAEVAGLVGFVLWMTLD